MIEPAMGIVALGRRRELFSGMSYANFRPVGFPTGQSQPNEQRARKSQIVTHT